MADITWYRPVCDDVLAKIYNWYRTYKTGDPSASRPFVGLDGRVVEKVTKYANRIRFRPNELAHLIRILEGTAKTPALVDFFRDIEKGLRRGRLIPGGEFEVVLNAYPQDVEETLVCLIRAKTGKLKSIEDLAKESMEQGKTPWGV